MRDSLKLLLTAIPGLRIVGEADDNSSGLRMVAEHRPALVLLDTNLSSDGVLALVRQIKAKESQTHHLVLVDDGQKQADASAAGAVLRRGFPAREPSPSQGWLFGPADFQSLVSNPQLTTQLLPRQPAHASPSPGA